MKIQTIANRVKRINTDSPAGKTNRQEKLLRGENRFTDYIGSILDGEPVEPVRKSDESDREYLDTIHRDLEAARLWQVKQLKKGSLYGQENDLREGKKLLEKPITYETVMQYRMTKGEVDICGQAIKQLKLKGEAGLKVQIVKLRKAFIKLIAQFDRKFANSKHGKALIAAGVLT